VIKVDQWVEWMCTVAEKWHTVREYGMVTGRCYLHGQVWQPSLEFPWPEEIGNRGN